MTEQRLHTALMAADLRAKDVNVIRAATDGSKKPLGKWKLFQTHKVSKQQVTDWFSDGYPGIGVVTGKVSGNLEMLEFEGRAVEAGIFETFEQTVDPELLAKIKSGWFEQTPSGGYHFYYRTENPPPGNRKLAIDENGETLIETRGEGGFSIVSPSNGTTHPSGKSWELQSAFPVAIPNLSEAERDNLFEVCRSFSQKAIEEPEEPAPTPTRKVELVASDGLVEKARKLAEKFTWEELLEKYGYTFSHKEGDESFWFRPGKTKEDGSHSISINYGGNNRLINFSSSIPHFTPADPSIPRGTKSYNKLELIAAYEYENDVVLAARVLVGANEGPPNLPDEFWNLSPIFQHIRQGAHARMNPADPVLAAVMWQICFRTDYRILIPGDLKAHAAPNLFVALVGASGEGKGSSIKIANSLFPEDHPWDSEAQINNLGSGEGIAKAYYGEVEEEETVDPLDLLAQAGVTKPKKEKKAKADPDEPMGYFDEDWDEPATLTVKSSKKIQKVKKIVRRHVAIRIDEGQQLESLKHRPGTTTFEVLRSAWSGEKLGTQNADETRNYPVPENRYRLALIMGVQPGKAEYLIKDSEGGTPQRFIWADVEVDPTIPDPRVQRVPWPGQLNLKLPRYEDFPLNDSDDEIRYFTVDDKITFDLLVAEYEKKTKRGNRPKELDSHRNLNKFKVAAVFAYMHGSTVITTEFWDWAEMFLQTSDGVRDHVINHITAKAKARDEAYKRRHVETKLAEVEAVESLAEKKLDRVAKRIAKHVHSEHASDGCSRTCHNRIVAGRDKHLLNGAIDFAIGKKWIKRNSDSTLVKGPSEPPE